MLKPDFSKVQEFILSNDAFFFLYQDEEPLDDINLAEALEIAEQFPTGYQILEGWSYVDTDLVEATFVPLIEEQDDFDGAFWASKTCQWQIKITQNGTHAKLWSYQSKLNKRRYQGEFELRISTLAKDKGKINPICFATGDYRAGKGCLIWLKDFKEVRPNSLRVSWDLQQGI